MKREHLHSILFYSACVLIMRGFEKESTFVTAVRFRSQIILWFSTCFTWFIALIPLLIWIPLFHVSYSEILAMSICICHTLVHDHAHCLSDACIMCVRVRSMPSQTEAYASRIYLYTWIYVSLQLSSYIYSHYYY